MKKLIGIALVLALFTGMAFAQEEDQDSKWKVGFMAQGTADLLYFSKLSGNTVNKNGTVTTTTEYGKYTKGAFNIFNGDLIPTPDNRLLLSLSNSGENHEVYADIAWDNWMRQFNGIMNFLNHASADWWVKGNAGAFNAQAGTASYDGFVDKYATWNDFLGWNTLCRFGVMKPGMEFLVGDDFRTWNEWGTIMGIGVTFLDSMRFSVGHKFGLGVPVWDNPAASQSSVNASFMFNAGGLANILNLDVFYAVKGFDVNTAQRDSSYWDNIFGVYAGMNPTDAIGVSLGVTTNFRIYEKFNDTSGDPSDPTKGKPGSIKSPMFIGIDLHASIGGIPVVDQIVFNNRFSLAGAKDGIAAADRKDKRVYGLNYTNIDADYKENWFAWETEVKASIDFITIHLANRLGVASSESTPPAPGTTETKKTTTDELRLSVTASKSMGALTLTSGVFGCLDITSYKNEEKTAANTTTDDDSFTRLTFGIPVLFKVAF